MWVKLEDKTREFKDSSHELNDFMEYPNFYRKWEITRSGFIDIAIYDPDYKPIYPIEVKLINPQKKRAQEDLVRLLDFLNGVERSTIKGGFFVYVFKKRIFGSLEQIPNDRENALTQAKKLISDLTHKVKSSLEYEYFCESIGNYTNFEIDNDMVGLDPFDLGELITENLHYVGVVIKIKTKHSGIQ
jgi:hypothetical protein